MSDIQALCMSCRETVDGKSKPTMQTVKDPVVGNMKKKDGTVMENRYCCQGQCSTCNGNVFKIMSKADAEKHM